MLSLYSLLVSQDIEAGSSLCILCFYIPSEAQRLFSSLKPPPRLIVKLVQSVYIITYIGCWRATFFFITTTLKHNLRNLILEQR